MSMSTSVQTSWIQSDPKNQIIEVWKSTKLLDTAGQLTSKPVGKAEGVTDYPVYWDVELVSNV